MLVKGATDELWRFSILKLINVFLHTLWGEIKTKNKIIITVPIFLLWLLVMLSADILAMIVNVKKILQWYFEV